MSKFTQFVSLALLVAMQAISGDAYAAPKAMLLGHRATASAQSAPEAKSTASRLNRAGMPVAVESPVKRVSPEDTVINKTPQGQLSNWTRYCYSYQGWYEEGPVSGMSQQMVTSEDGKTAYINVICAGQMLFESWIKADRNENGDLIFSEPQLVWWEGYDDEIERYYFVPMTLSVDDEEYTSVAMAESVTLKYEGGKYTSSDNALFGICSYSEEDEEFYYTDNGDTNITFLPMNDTPKTTPDGVETETWVALYDGGGYFVNVGINGDNIYIAGLLEENPEYCVEGTINGNSVTIPAGQFLGCTTLDWSWAYLYGGTIESVWNEEWEDYVDQAKVTGDVHFDYDSEAKELASKEKLIFAANKTTYYDEAVCKFYLNIEKIVKQTRNPETKPQAPTDLLFNDTYESYGYSDFNFVIPEFDLEGNLLDKENLYYRIYVDGEPFKFYQDEYVEIPVDGQELIPAYYTDYDIFYDGNYKTVFMYMDGIDEVGVQSVYIQPTEGGTPIEICSEIATMPTSGLNKVSSDASIEHSTFYDLQGRKVDNPNHGLYIRRDNMTDGSVKATKVAIR